MRFELLVYFITWRLAFCGRQLKYFHDPYLRSVNRFAQLCLRLHFWQLLRCFIVLGHFDLITARFFGVPAAKFHLFSFFFKFDFFLSRTNKFDSRSLKCLFLSTSRIASSRACWGVYNCLEYDKFASVLLCFICALAMSCGPCGRNQ